jgi:hypothetical protein
MLSAQAVIRPGGKHKNQDGGKDRKGEVYMQFMTKGICNRQKTLTLTDDKAVYEEKGGFCCGPLQDEVVINDIRFFDVTKSITGKCQVHFGYKDQILMKGLKPEEAGQIKNHILSHGAKLGEDANWVKKGLGNCCCASDSIAVTEDGVMYRFQKGGDSRSSFVGWGDVNVASFPKGGCCGNNIIMLGELDIVTQKTFSAGTVAKIKKNLDAKGLKSAEGKVYRPFLLKHWKEHFANCVILTENGVVAKMDKKAANASSLPSSSGRAIYIPYKNITRIATAGNLFDSKETKQWFVIEGEIFDLRSNSAAEVKICMLKPFCCTWYSLKKAVKSRMGK